MILPYRPWKDGFAMRLHYLQATDPGNFNKGDLGGLQVDYRDPTADVRLLEFCFAVPMEQFLRDGTPRALARRALADRLPKQVLEQNALRSIRWPTGTKTSRPRAMAS